GRPGPVRRRADRGLFPLPLGPAPGRDVRLVGPQVRLAGAGLPHRLLPGPARAARVGDPPAAFARRALAAGRRGPPQGRRRQPAGGRPAGARGRVAIPKVRRPGAPATGWLVTGAPGLCAYSTGSGSNFSPRTLSPGQSSHWSSSVV